MVGAVSPYSAHRCNATIEGPKVGRRVVAWRRYCQRKVKEPGTRCWQHTICRCHGVLTIYCPDK